MPDSLLDLFDSLKSQQDQEIEDAVQPMSEEAVLEMAGLSTPGPLARPASDIPEREEELRASDPTRPRSLPFRVTAEGVERNEDVPLDPGPTLGAGEQAELQRQFEDNERRIAQSRESLRTMADGTRSLEEAEQEDAQRIRGRAALETVLFNTSDEEYQAMLKRMREDDSPVGERIRFLRQMEDIFDGTPRGLLFRRERLKLQDDVEKGTAVGEQGAVTDEERVLLRNQIGERASQRMEDDALRTAVGRWHPAAAAGMLALTGAAKSGADLAATVLDVAQATGVSEDIRNLTGERLSQVREGFVDAGGDEFSAAVVGGAGELLGDIPAMVAGGRFAQNMGGWLRSDFGKAFIASQPLSVQASFETAAEGGEKGLQDALSTWALNSVIPGLFGRTGVEGRLTGMTKSKFMESFGKAVDKGFMAGVYEGAEEGITEFGEVLYEISQGRTPELSDAFLQVATASLLGFMAGTASETGDVAGTFAENLKRGKRMAEIQKRRTDPAREVELHRLAETWREGLRQRQLNGLADAVTALDPRQIADQLQGETNPSRKKVEKALEGAGFIPRTSQQDRNALAEVVNSLGPSQGDLARRRELETQFEAEVAGGVLPGTEIRAAETAVGGPRGEVIDDPAAAPGEFTQPAPRPFQREPTQRPEPVQEPSEGAPVEPVAAPFAPDDRGVIGLEGSTREIQKTITDAMGPEFKGKVRLAGKGRWTVETADGEVKVVIAPDKTGTDRAQYVVEAPVKAGPAQGERRRAVLIRISDKGEPTVGDIRHEMIHWLRDTGQIGPEVIEGLVQDPRIWNADIEADLRANKGYARQIEGKSPERQTEILQEEAVARWMEENRENPQPMEPQKEGWFAGITRGIRNLIRSLFGRPPVNFNPLGERDTVAETSDAVAAQLQSDLTAGTPDAVAIPVPGARRAPTPPQQSRTAAEPEASAKPADKKAPKAAVSDKKPVKKASPRAQKPVETVEKVVVDAAAQNLRTRKAREFGIKKKDVPRSTSAPTGSAESLKLEKALDETGGKVLTTDRTSVQKTIQTGEKLLKDMGLDAAEEHIINAAIDGRALNVAEVGLGRVVLEKLREKAAVAVETDQNPAEASERAVRFELMYKELGTTSAQALAMRRDTKWGPEERSRILLESIMAPPPGVKRMIASARKKGDFNRVAKLVSDWAAQAEVIMRKAAERGLEFGADVSISQTAKELNRLSKDRAHYGDMVIEYWINSLLTGPATHAKNIISNVASVAFDTFVTKTVEGIVGSAAKGIGKGQGMFGISSLPQLYSGFFRGLIPAVKNAGRAWYHERSLFEAEVRGFERALSKVDVDKEGSVAGPKIPGIGGRAVRAFGTDMLMAADDFFKTIAAHANVAVEADRLASERGLKGKERADFIAEQMITPSDGNGSEAWVAAVENAEELLFQTELDGFMRKVQELRNFEVESLGGFKPVVLLIPFIKTPTNIFRTGLRKTPLGVLAPFLRGVRKYTAERAGLERAEEMPGMFSGKYIQRDIAEQIIAWFTTMAVFALMEGEAPDEGPWLTGSASKNPNQRKLDYETNRDPYSIYLPGYGRINYSSVEPFSTGLAILADGVKSYQEADIEGQNRLLAFLSGAVSSVGSQTVDKTFLRGLGDIIGIAFDHEPSAAFKQYVADFFASWVPNGFRQLVRSQDEDLQETRRPDVVGESTFADAFIHAFRLDVFGDGQYYPKRDSYGRPVKRNSADAPLLKLVNYTMPTSLRPTDELTKGQRILTAWNDASPSAQDVFIAAPKSSYSKKLPGKPKAVSTQYTSSEYDQLVRLRGDMALKIEAQFLAGANENAPKIEDLGRVSLQFSESSKYAKEMVLTGNADKWAVKHLKRAAKARPQRPARMSGERSEAFQARLTEHEGRVAQWEQNRSDSQLFLAASHYTNDDLDRLAKMASKSTGVSRTVMERRRREMLSIPLEVDTVKKVKP